MTLRHFAYEQIIYFYHKNMFPYPVFRHFPRMYFITDHIESIYVTLALLNSRNRDRVNSIASNSDQQGQLPNAAVGSRHLSGIPRVLPIPPPHCYHSRETGFCFVRIQCLSYRRWIRYSGRSS